MLLICDLRICDVALLKISLFFWKIKVLCQSISQESGITQYPVTVLPEWPIFVLRWPYWLHLSWYCDVDQYMLSILYIAIRGVPAQYTGLKGIIWYWNASDIPPNKHKTFVHHLYYVGPTSSTLIQHFTNVIQMFCVDFLGGWQTSRGCQVMQHIWIDPLCILFFNHFFTRTRIKNGEFSIS